MSKVTHMVAQGEQAGTCDPTEITNPLTPAEMLAGFGFGNEAPAVETAPTATPAATGRGKGAVPKDQALIGLTNEWLGGAAIRSNHAKIMGCERKGSITTHLKNLARDGKIEIRYLDESKGINGPCEYRLRQGE